MSTPFATISNSFFFQLGFGITAASIVSGALRDKIALLPYCAVIVAFGAGIYPLFGHLAWADSGWLNTGWTIWGRRYAFHDFAGSTVVHSVAAWVALSGNQILGVSPVQWRLRGTQELQASGLSYRLPGIMLIWFGAWGFNAGTAILQDGSVAAIILNTNLAAASAGIVAFLHARGSTLVYAKLVGGVVGGLVAIAASCDVVSPTGAIVIGGVAGLTHNFAFDWCLRKRLADLTRTVPPHGVCGAVGTLCAAGAVAWYCWRPSEGLVALGVTGAVQLGIQIAGVTLAYLLTRALSLCVFWSAETTLGLRPSVLDWVGYGL